MVKSHLSKKLWGLVKMTLRLVHATLQLQLAQGTSCKTDLLCSLLNSKFFFLNCYSNIIEEKKGPHRFPNKTPLLGVHWAADCPVQWFNALRSTFVQIITTLFSRLSWAAYQTFFFPLGQVGQAQKMRKAKRSKTAMQARLECIAMHTQPFETRNNNYYWHYF